MLEKYKNFILKAFQLLVIAAALFFYQNHIELKNAVAAAEQSSKEAALAREQLAQLTAELDKMQLELGDEAALAEEAKEAASGYQDGTYNGEGDGFGGIIAVAVTISGGAITDIQIESAADEDAAYLEMAKGVIDKVLDAQSIEVDTISGATFSSNGILTAVGQALAEAEK